MTFDGFPFKRKSVFRYPLDPAPRTAVLAACFRQAWFSARSTIRVFPHGWSEDVAAFAPAAVAADREQLFGLAAVDRPPVFTHAGGQATIVSSQRVPVYPPTTYAWSPITAAETSDAGCGSLPTIVAPPPAATLTISSSWLGPLPPPKT